MIFRRMSSAVLESLQKTPFLLKVRFHWYISKTESLTPAVTVFHLLHLQSSSPRGESVMWRGGKHLIGKNGKGYMSALGQQAVARALVCMSVLPKEWYTHHTAAQSALIFVLGLPYSLALPWTACLLSHPKARQPDFPVVIHCPPFSPVSVSHISVCSECTSIIVRLFWHAR